MSDDLELKVRMPVFGKTFDIDACDAVMVSNGEVVFGDMNVENIIAMLHEFTSVVLKFGMALNLDESKLRELGVDDDTYQEYRLALAKVSIMLIALGSGREGVTVENTIRKLFEPDEAEQLLDAFDEETETEI